MTLQFKEIVDLGHEYFNGMLNIGGPMVAFWPLETHEHYHQITGGKLSMEGRMILMPEHCGTHIDVPRHFVPGGTDVIGIPLETLILPGHLLDLTHRKNGEAITVADLERAEEKSGKRIGPGTATMIWTACDKDWGKPNFTMVRPYLPTDSAQWLVDRKITLLCTDLIGMDDPDEWWWPSHKIWLDAGICMVQQLCNLDRLAGKEFLFVCLPLKMREGTASPVRPVALVS
jgi:kynurenine formamidase